MSDQPAVREFTFSAFEWVTPDLNAHERLAVFLALPVDLQGEAWQKLGERIERQNRARFAEHRLGGECTPAELAMELAAIWDEAKLVPLAGVEVDKPARVDWPARGGRSARRPPTEPEGDLDFMCSIPSAQFVPTLTGREVVRGFVGCPLHASGEERTPSLHVSDTDGAWFCHGCQQGGGILDFYAALQGRVVPRGGEFVELVREIARALLGAAA